jgi:hypothetical protein
MDPARPPYQLYLHVGYPKTGTTFLQQEIFPKLSGVHYIPYASAKPELCTIMRQGEVWFDESGVKASLERLFRPGKNLISKESLIGDFFVYKMINSSISARRLAALFPGARILITIRNQYDMMESVYKQYLHIGGVKKFRDFVQFKGGRFETRYDKWDPGVTIEMFDYLKVIRLYESLFGRANLLVLPYEGLGSDAQTFVRRIASWIGLPETPAFANRHYNQGYGAWQAAISRHLNKFLRSKYNERPLIPDVRLPWAGKVDAGKVRVVMQSGLSKKLLGTRPLCDLEMKRGVRRWFDRSNREMDLEYGLGLRELHAGSYFDEDSSNGRER